MLRYLHLLHQLLLLPHRTLLLGRLVIDAFLQLGRFVLRLAPLFFFPSINLYITPPGRRAALPLHSDAQDVMILQVGPDCPIPPTPFGPRCA